MAELRFSSWFFWLYRKLCLTTISCHNRKTVKWSKRNKDREVWGGKSNMLLYSGLISLSSILHILSLFCFGSDSLYGHKFLFTFFSNQFTLHEFRDIDKSIWKSQAAFLKVIVLAGERYRLRHFQRRKTLFFDQWC